MHYFKRVLPLPVALGLLAGGQTLLASSPLVIEELVVTARKQSELLQDVPLSISAFSQQELEKRNMMSLGDIQSVVPNMAMNSGISRSNAGIFIRGVGQSDRSVTYDPGVGLYIDGVYRARMQGSMIDLLDIERIEVLRGPQGTLYGRNTIGGAVNITTTAPAAEPGLRVKAGIGNYNLRSAQVIADLPWTDRLFSRLSMGYTERDGVTKNVHTGKKWDDKNFVGAQLDVRWLASDDLTVDMAADWSRRRQESNGGQCVVEDPTAGMMVYAGMLGLPYQEACQRSSELKERQFSMDEPSRDDGDDWGLSLIADWDLSDALSFKSITAVRRLDWALYESFDGTELEIYASRNKGSEQKQLSQEFQLQGTALDDQLVWNVGLYAFKEKVRRPALSDSFIQNRFSDRLRKTDNESYAIYGQATYDINDAWSLTAGIRYTYEERKFDNAEQDVATGVIHDAVKVNASFDAVTPLLTLAWRATDDVMIYSTWAQGYKSGGFNSRTNASQPETLEPFDEETVDTYELGMKSTWLDRRLTLNAAMYYSDYKDMQRAVTRADASGNPVSLFQNAGSARISGAELDLNLVVTQHWRISGGYGYTDARYRSFKSLDGATGTWRDLSSLQFASTPRNTGSLSSEWVVPVHAGALDDVTLRVDYSHADSTYNDMENTEGLKRRSLDLVNAAVILSFNDGVTTLNLWGKNLTNQVYYRSGFSLADSFGIAQRFFSEPRTYGLTVSHEF